MKWETYVRAQDLKLDRQLGSGIPQGAERPIITNSNLTGNFPKTDGFQAGKNQTTISVGDSLASLYSSSWGW